MTESINDESPISAKTWRTTSLLTTAALILSELIYCDTKDDLNKVRSEYYAYERSRKQIPPIEKVQSGYVPPSKLEVLANDIDNDGEQETIVKVDGTSYLLKYDPDNEGRPQLFRFKVHKIVVEGNSESIPK